ncbi:MAG: hypothetical protein WC473_00145 [Patescibacteria group bacterium]
MPTKTRNKTPAKKLDILDLLIVVFHLSGPKLISRLSDCEAIIDSRIGRICNVLKELSSQKRFADFFQNCRFYHYSGCNGDWYEDSIGTALWCMEMADLITEINTQNKSEYIFLKKLHYQGQQVLETLTPEKCQKIQALTNELVKLLKKGEKHYA